MVDVARCLLLLLALTGTGTRAMAPAPAAADPLILLNSEFHATYARTKATALAHSGPVLLVSAGHLALYRDGAQVAQEEILPPLYHQLKAVAHVPLALHLLLSAPEPPAPAKVAAWLGLVKSSRAGLGERFPPADLPRERQILDGCVELLEELRSLGALTPVRLAAFSARMGPLTVASADEAAGLELERLDRATATFRASLGRAEWARVRAVIIGAHMPRDGEVAQQYFLRLLGEPGEGRRVVYAESLWEPAAALDLLATHEVDEAVGAAFFSEPMRMHRDLLADGARRWLEAHPRLAG